MHRRHHPRPLRVATALGTVLLTATTISCGAKAAPDIDPPTKNNAAPPSSSSTTTTAPTTTTTIDPGTLPQTNDRPDASSPEFQARMDLLWQAIVANDPDKALPAFFPVTSYQQVKDLKDPTADWNDRLIATFKKEIAGYHKQLQSQLSQQKAAATKIEPQMVSVNVPNGGVQWINPKVEYNKLGYFRVFDSKLNYTINGKPFSFNIKSLISWRGQWYVVHLASI